MFSEVYVERAKNQKQALVKKKKISLFSFKKKKKDVVVEETKETPPQPNLEVKPKPIKKHKKRSTNFYAAVIFSVIIVIIAGLKGYKQYKENQLNEITVQEKAAFNSAPTSSEKNNNIQKVKDVQKTKVENQELVNKEQNELNDKRIISRFLLSQKKSVLLEQNGIKLMLSGERFSKNQNIYKDYVIKDIQIEGEGGLIENAIFNFIIAKNDIVVKEIKVKLGTAYTMYYFYEAIKIEPIGNSSLITKMIFPKEQIKKDFLFESFSEDDMEVHYHFKLLGKDFHQDVSLNDLL